LIAAAVSSGRVIDYALPGRRLDLTGKISHPAWLLYPDPAGRLPEEKPGTLVVVDGSWPQARRMRQRICELRGLPIMSLPPHSSCPRERGEVRRGVFLREQQRDGELPTALAVADALVALGEAQAAQALRNAYAALLRKMIGLGKTRLRATAESLEPALIARALEIE
jgi:DTW domain-containing protein YfiP